MMLVYSSYGNGEIEVNIVLLSKRMFLLVTSQWVVIILLLADYKFLIHRTHPS